MTPRKAKVLVVDDEQGLRDLLKQELTEAGYAVDTACDGEEAIKKAVPGRYQLAISDLNMPKVSGLDALRQIRQIDPDIEVIVMTGYASVESAVEAMKNGAYDYIQKPFNLDEMLLLVEKSLEKSEMRTMMGVYKASQFINRSIQFDSLLNDVSEVVLKILKAKCVRVLIPDDNGKFEVKAIAGSTAGSSDTISDDELLKNNEPLLTKTRIVFPLMIEKNFLGVIDVRRSDDEEPFHTLDMRYTTVLGCQIAQAIHNAKLYSKLEQMMEELKNAQVQLVQSEKMVSLGQLAAGVAHELNNPLTGIYGFTELLLDDVQLPHHHRRDLETIHEQSRRCRTIIQNLLHFSRRNTIKKEESDLISIVEAALALIQYDFSTSGIHIVKKFTCTGTKVMVDPGQLQQVFINLLTNARHAMERATSPQLTIEVEQSSSVVRVRFIDNGCGISNDIMSKIFDPFFTTKSPGKGTGLGLSICHGIMEQHGGHLTVESQAGRGATFTVELPIYEE
jgi:signal transduction histidine kinase/ActR/RegA family two-component response regulator